MPYERIHSEYGILLIKKIKLLNVFFKMHFIRVPTTKVSPPM